MLPALEAFNRFEGPAGAAPRSAWQHLLDERLPTAGMGRDAVLDALNEAVLGRLRRRGRSLPSSTRVDGRFVIRACFINPRSRRTDAERLVEDVLAVGRELVAVGLV